MRPSPRANLVRPEKTRAGHRLRLSAFGLQLTFARTGIGKFRFLRVLPPVTATPRAGRLGELLVRFLIGLCCKSPKMPRDQFPAHRVNKLQSPADVASKPLPEGSQMRARPSRRDARLQLMQPLPFWLEVKVTTNGDDAANHSDGRGTNRSGGRDRHDGPTHAHARDRL